MNMWVYAVLQGAVDNLLANIEYVKKFLAF